MLLMDSAGFAVDVSSAADTPSLASLTSTAGGGCRVNGAGE